MKKGMFLHIIAITLVVIFVISIGLFFIIIVKNYEYRWIKIIRYKVELRANNSAGIGTVSNDSIEYIFYIPFIIEVRNNTTTSNLFTKLHNVGNGSLKQLELINTTYGLALLVQGNGSIILSAETETSEIEGSNPSYIITLAANNTTYSLEGYWISKYYWIYGNITNKSNCKCEILYLRLEIEHEEYCTSSKPLTCDVIPPTKRFYLTHQTNITDWMSVECVYRCVYG